MNLCFSPGLIAILHLNDCFIHVLMWQISALKCILLSWINLRLPTGCEKDEWLHLHIKVLHLHFSVCIVHVDTLFHIWLQNVLNSLFLSFWLSVSSHLRHTSSFAWIRCRNFNRKVHYTIIILSRKFLLNCKSTI